MIKLMTGKKNTVINIFLDKKTIQTTTGPMVFNIF